MTYDHKNRYDINGYKQVKPKDEKLIIFDKNNFKYEHRVIAEENLGRELKSTEDVHHLDGNRSNNSPDNLLVLEKSQHVKLESWLDKNIIIPKPNYMFRKIKGCVRCKHCEKPIKPDNIFCSQECYNANNILENKTKLHNMDNDLLKTLLKTTPITKIGEMFGVSDNGIRKYCKNKNIELPKREPGYWTKLKHGLTD